MLLVDLVPVFYMISIWLNVIWASRSWRFYLMLLMDHQDSKSNRNALVHNWWSKNCESWMKLQIVLTNSSIINCSLLFLIHHSLFPFIIALLFPPTSSSWRSHYEHYCYCFDYYYLLHMLIKPLIWHYNYYSSTLDSFRSFWF